MPSLIFLLDSTDICVGSWKQHGTSCYTALGTATNYYQAVRECEQRSSHLIAINNRAENTFLVKLVKAELGNVYGAWLGKNVAKRG